MNNVLLLHSDISKGMKSYGPKGLMPVGSKKTPFIIQQIDNVEKSYKGTDFQIHIVVGFEKEKLIGIIKKFKKNIYSKINFIQHDNFVRDNQGPGFIWGLQQINKGNIFVIPNGILTKNIFLANQNHNIIPIFKHNKESGCHDNICVRTENEQVKYLFYGLDYEWTELCYFTEASYDTIRNISTTALLQHGHFFFEHINSMIEKGIVFNYKFLNRKKITKIINHKHDYIY